MPKPTKSDPIEDSDSGQDGLKRDHVFVITIPKVAKVKRLGREVIIGVRKIIGLSAAGIEKDDIHFDGPPMNDDDVIKLGKCVQGYRTITVRKLKELCTFIAKPVTLKGLMKQMSRDYKKITHFYIDHGSEYNIYDSDGRALDQNAYEEILKEADKLFDLSAFFVFSCGSGAFIQRTWIRADPPLKKVVVISSTEGAEGSFGSLPTISTPGGTAFASDSMAWRAVDQKALYEGLSTVKLTEVASKVNEQDLGGFRITVTVGTEVGEQTFGDIAPPILTPNDDLPPDRRETTVEDDRLSGQVTLSSVILLFVDDAASALFGVRSAYAIYDGKGLTRCDQRGTILSPKVEVSIQRLKELGWRKGIVLESQDGDDDRLGAMHSELGPLASFFGISLEDAAWLLYD
jgi:hypothetical protein